VSAPGAAGHPPPLVALLNALGFEQVEAPGAAGEQPSVLAAFVASETFRWLRRWAVVAVVAIVTPITVITGYANEMPAFHHVAVPIPTTVIVAAWLVELSGVRWPRLALVAAVVLPNVWLTLIGHVSTNYLWLLLLVGWVAFAGTRAEGLTALGLAFATITLGVSVIVAPAIGVFDWGFWTEWAFGLLLTLAFDLVLLALTGALVVALARLPGRYRRLARRGVDRWPDLLRRTGLIAGLHLVWPVAVLYLALAVPLWRVDVGLGQPDLTAWLEAVAMVVFLKGLLELALTWRAFRPTDRRPSHRWVWRWSR
jgi:hypothetical protein